jgi:opacity protein-like surface antigen
MKKLFAILAAACSLLMPTEGHAKYDLEMYYVGLQSGANFLNIQPHHHLRYKPIVGFTVAGVAGYRFRCGWRFEVEANYRRNYLHYHMGDREHHLPQLIREGSHHHKQHHGHTRSFTYMANGYYEFGWPFVSYNKVAYTECPYTTRIKDGYCPPAPCESLNFCKWILHFQPYVGAGIGYSRVHTKLYHHHLEAHGFSDGFAWQVMGGLNYT